MKVTLNTIKEIIVLNTHKTSVENLTKSEAISDQPNLMWCNGILFNISYTVNEQTFIKQTQGIEYLENVIWAYSDNIQKSIWNGYSVECQDQTGHPIAESLTKSLKENDLE